MKKIEWENYQDGDSTPLNAENLNLMQDNIEEAINEATPSVVVMENGTNPDHLTSSGLYFCQEFSELIMPRQSATDVNGGLVEVINAPNHIFQKCYITYSYSWQSEQEVDSFNLFFFRKGSKSNGNVNWNHWSEILEEPKG